MDEKSGTDWTMSDVGKRYADKFETVGNGALPIWETWMVTETLNVGERYADKFEKERNGSLPIWEDVVD